jgi:hypothetical protein
VKRPLLFLVKLLLISLVLIPVFNWFDAGYFYLIKAAHLRPLKQIAFVSSDALYPFFVLVLATPGLSLKRRILSIVAVVPLALAIDLTMIYVWGTLPFMQDRHPTLTHIWAAETWHVTMRWLLPILLWMVVAYRQIEELFRGAVPEGRV